MKDLIIIGSGPAGISAALTAKKRNLDFLWFGSDNLSWKVEKAEKVMNYPGLIDVTGQEMQDVFKKQIQQAGLTITPERIDAVYNMGEYFAAAVNDKIYESRTIILALGMANTRDIPGEMELAGRGVSYCATCDGALYKGKEIAVCCTNREFEDEIRFLAGLAAKVYLFTTYKDCGVQAENVEHIPGYPAAVQGTDRVEAIVSRQGEIKVDGVFFLKDSVNPAVLLSGLQMDDNYIAVDRRQQTNIDGCYAAGDCTGRPFQYAKAVGEGNVAVHSAVQYLDEKNKQQPGENN